jgi:four helix bundle protein
LIGELTDSSAVVRHLHPKAAMSIAEELRQRTFRYALRIITFCRKLPDSREGAEISRQLLRAGMGTAANYWSACRGRSGREFVAKLGVAADEAGESILWLMLIVQSGIRDDEHTKQLLGEGREITAILSKSHKTAKENRKRKQKNQLPKLPTNQITN